MHNNVIEYIKTIKEKFPDKFTLSKVLDVGSLDINGNNSIFFNKCVYIWLDIIQWPNVDIVKDIKDFTWRYDTIISTEMLEHNKYWKEWLLNMYNILNEWWLLLVTCANVNRKEHWTTRTTPQDSPATNDYYKNISPSEILEILPNAIVSEDNSKLDTYFYLIK